MTNVQDLLERYAAVSLEKQLALGELIGTASWFANLDKGTVTFGDKYQFPVQVLGSEDVSAATWLWAWANTGSNIPAQLLDCANDVRTFGMRSSIPEFTTPEIPLNQIDGHRLALIASGLCNAACYYRGPYEGGAVFFIIPEAPQVQANITSSPMRLINVFTYLIQTISLNHRNALESYLDSKGYTCKTIGTAIEATNAQGQTINADFDKSDHLTRLDSLGKTGNI